MRELTSAEIEHASGGVAISTSIAIGIATSIVGSYIVQKLGGAEGIDRKIKAAVSGLVESAKGQSATCQKAPAACMG